MGELISGQPALRLTATVSLPLDLVSGLSLLYRAVPGSGLDPWLVEARRALPPDLRADLDLLHGFSGRLLYYLEEPVMRFAPLAPPHRDAGVADLLTFLSDLPPLAYRDMAAHALARVHQDVDSDVAPPAPTDAAPEAAWRRALEPALTTADADEILPLLLDSAELKTRTLRLFHDAWEAAFQGDHAGNAPMLREATRAALPVVDRGFGLAFADLTGSRPPSTLIARLGDVEAVTFCPSAHLGSFVSYILYPPELVVFFSAPRFLASRFPTNGTSVSNSLPPPPPGADSAPALLQDALIDALRALADPTRLRILDLLGDGELYAQEIVGRLAIAQSAVSRHLALLERAGLVVVRPHRGSKYYAVDQARLDSVADALRRPPTPDT